jgi:hypothetical protein
MPTNQINIQATNYNGEILNLFIRRAIAKNTAVRKGLIAIQAGIKSKLEVPTLKVSGMVQPRVYEPDADKHSGKVTINKRELKPQDMMFLLVFLPAIFEAYWLNVQLSPALLDEELPLTAENAIIQEIMEQGGKELDQHLFTAVYQPTKIQDAIDDGFADGDDRKIFFNGIIPKLLNDSNVIDISSPDVLTKANIFDKFELVKLAIPPDLKEGSDVVYLVSPTTLELYELAQQGQGYKGANVTDAGKRTYGGKRVEALIGVPDNTIIAGVFKGDMYSNFWIGLNEPDEQDNIKMDKVTNMGEYWFLKSLFKMDVNYGFGEEVVLYTTWALPNGVTYTPY